MPFFHKNEFFRACAAAFDTFAPYQGEGEEKERGAGAPLKHPT